MSELHMEVTGAGGDVLLLHGWGLNLRVWDGVVAQLSNRFRLITLDLPGHGRSPWPARGFTPAEQAWLIHQQVASLSNRYAVIGWSLGGQLALDLAAATPAQIERLVLVASTAKFTAAADWPHGTAPQAVADLAARLRADHRRTVSDYLDLQIRNGPGAGAEREALRAAVLQHGQAQPAALEADLRMLAASDLRHTLAGIHMPALVIAGQYDRIISPAASRELVHGLPNARYVEMARAAHAPFISHPAEFASRISAFLRAPVRRTKKRRRSPDRAHANGKSRK